MNKKVSKGYKFLSHAHIDYLTGFDATNIYHVWVPHLKWIFRARDIWIDEIIKFNLINPYLDSLIIIEINDLIHVIKIPDLPDDAHADFNYQYKDWDNILASGLGPLLLESL